MPRNYLNYSGQVSQPFTVLAAFLKDGNTYRFEFDTWRSTTDFNNDAEAFGPLRRSVTALPAFGTTNATLLTSLRDLFLGEMGLTGRGFTLQNASWLPIVRVLTLTALQGENSATFAKQGADYTAFINANLTSFQNLNTAIWNYSKANDPFFERMTPAT